MKKTFENEIELKEYLDTFQIRYGDTETPNKVFLVYFKDNKGNTIISRGLYSSPIGAVRDVASLLKKISLPIDDIDINLIGVLKEDTNSYHPIDCLLSTKLYFPEPEKEKENKESDSK